MSKFFKDLRERVETSLRGVCGRVSPDRRAAVVIVMLACFAALNIWITARAIWSIGRGEAPRYKIEIPLNENNAQQLLKTEKDDTTNIEQQGQDGR
ncbi:MAG: TraL conjugative transposon family protein [Alistipes sp.]|jgi:hypothetical protein|nr:TraL conjugative transposon family protein [Alistipes sp.]